jgi:hypothetical protein
VWSTLPPTLPGPFPPSRRVFETVIRNCWHVATPSPGGDPTMRRVMVTRRDGSQAVIEVPEDLIAGSECGGGSVRVDARCPPPLFSPPCAPAAETPYLIKKFLQAKGLDIVDVALVGGSSSGGEYGGGSADSPLSQQYGGGQRSGNHYAPSVRGDEDGEYRGGGAGSMDSGGEDGVSVVRPGPIAGAISSSPARHGRRAVPTAFAGAQGPIFRAFFAARIAPKNHRPSPPPSPPPPLPLPNLCAASETGGELWQHRHSTDSGVHVPPHLGEIAARSTAAFAAAAQKPVPQFVPQFTR